MKDKKEIYATFGIEYKAGYINAPIYGWIPVLLLDGNDKLGKGVWTWSTLPTNGSFVVHVNGELVEMAGTCPLKCDGCYADGRGRYRMRNVIESLAKKTFLTRVYMDFVKRAILAQIIADEIKILRIHAAGDFFSDAYLQMWLDIIRACPDTIFWTYTKVTRYEPAFDAFPNANIVKSIIRGHGFNFGHCDYILDTYNALRAAGESVYICRCGIDKNQHCINCKGCMSNKYVLFVEHSTEYKAEKDPLFPVLRAVVESQQSMETEAA